MKNPAAIHTENLSIGYGKKPVLPTFDLTIERAKMNVMVGANGTGKSTLLHTLNGNIPVLGGRIELLGTDLRAMSRRKLAQTLSLVYTERLVSGGLTVREVVEMGRHPHTGYLGNLSAADKVIVDRAMNDVGIAHKSDVFLSELSDGERQKAMIARALAQQTPILMLDEPTNFLDIAARLELFELIRLLVTAHGLTAVLSTHDMSALQYADNVISIVANDAENPVSNDAAGSAECTRRLDRIFSDRNIRYDPVAKDFKLTEGATQNLTELK